MSTKRELAVALILYLLRMVQITSLSITTFCVCYLVWMHQHHICVYRYCGGGVRDSDGKNPQEHTSVPMGEVMMIVAVSLPAKHSVGLPGLGVS